MLLGQDGPRIFVRKPAALPVFPPHADPLGPSLLRWIEATLPGRDAAWPTGFEGGIAHRLDTATAGVMVVARDPAALAELRAHWGQVRKWYRFTSLGAVAWDDRVVEDPIAHHRRRADRMVVRTHPRTAHRGKWYPAWTRLQRDPGGPLRWLAEIRTGVMHQVRVHAAVAGVPLAGDPIYGTTPGEFDLEAIALAGPGWSFGRAPAG